MVVLPRVLVFRCITHQTTNSSAQTRLSRARSSRSTPHPSASGTNRTTPSLSRRSSPRRLRPVLRARPRRRRRGRTIWSVSLRRGRRTRSLIRCWRRSLVQVGCTLPFQAGRGRLVGRMGIFLRVKSWRCVSLGQSAYPHFVSRMFPHSSTLGNSVQASTSRRSRLFLCGMPRFVDCRYQKYFRKFRFARSGPIPSPTCPSVPLRFSCMAYMQLRTDYMSEKCPDPSSGTQTGTAMTYEDWET
jgi:hypothetical protein